MPENCQNPSPRFHRLYLKKSAIKKRNFDDFAIFVFVSSTNLKSRARLQGWRREQRRKKKKFYSLKLTTPSWEELLKKRNLCLWDHFFFLLDELDSDTKYQCAKPDSANLLQWWHRPSPSNIIIRGLRANFHKGEYERNFILDDHGWFREHFCRILERSLRW